MEGRSPCLGRGSGRPCCVVRVLTASGSGGVRLAITSALTVTGFIARSRRGDSAVLIDDPSLWQPPLSRPPLAVDAQARRTCPEHGRKSHQELHPRPGGERARNFGEAGGDEH